MAIRTATLYQGEDQSPQLDYTDQVIWEESEFGTRAYLGEGNASTVVIRDPLGEQGSFVNLPVGLSSRSLAAKNLFIIKVGSDFLFRGRVGIKNYSRDGQQIERYRQVECSLHDTNWDLDHIFVHNYDRPAENDRQRTQGLIASYLSGSPRPTTALNGSNFISGSNLVLLPAQTYTRTSPLGIIREISTSANKQFFVTGDTLTGGSLFYDGNDSTAYASTLSISDRQNEVNYTSIFPPIWNVGPASTEDGAEMVCEAVLFWGTGEDQFVTAHDLVVHTQYGHASETFTDDTITSEAEAQTKVNSIVAFRSREDRTYNVTIGPLTDAQVVLIKHGQTISIKARAIPDADDAARTMRIVQCRYTTPIQGTWFAHLQLGRPWKMQPYSTGPVLVPQAPVTYPDCDPTDSFEPDYNEDWSGTWTQASDVDPPVWSSVAAIGFGRDSDRGDYRDYREFFSGGEPGAPGAGLLPGGTTYVRLRGTVSHVGSIELGLPPRVWQLHKGDWDVADMGSPPDFDHSAGVLAAGTLYGVDPDPTLNFYTHDAVDVSWRVDNLTAPMQAQWILHSLSAPDSPGDYSTVALEDVTLDVYDCDPALVSTTPPSLGGPGEGSFGTPGTYLPADAVIEHGDLSGKGGTMHDASQIELTPFADIAATDVQDGLEEVALQPVRKNSTGTVFERRRLNLIEGTNVTLTVADDGANNEVDITIASSAGGSGITVEDADESYGSVDTVVFDGAEITDDGGGQVTVAITGSGITVDDEGTPLSTAATELDFVGAGVTATGAGTTKTITIPGGGAFDPTTSLLIYDDMYFNAVADALAGSIVLTGGGTQAAVLTTDRGHPGVLEVSTGTSSTGRRGLSPTNNQELLAGADELTFGVVTKVPVLSDGTETFTINWGLSNGATAVNSNQQILFRYTHSLNSGNFTGICREMVGGTESSLDTGVAVTTGWHRLELVVNAAASSVEFFIDDASVGTISSNIPTTLTKAMPANIIKSAGTTARVVHLDAYWYMLAISPAR